MKARFQMHRNIYSNALDQTQIFHLYIHLAADNCGTECLMFKLGHVYLLTVAHL